MPEKFRDCFECGGKCCKFFGVPAEFKNMIHSYGVLIELYAFELDPDPTQYFEMREGVRIIGDGKRFIVDKDVETSIMDTRLGWQIIVYSQCSKLDENGRCTIYEDRPATCKIFDERTVDYYNVPSGCIYDPGNCGEDFGV